MGDFIGSLFGGDNGAGEMVATARRAAARASGEASKQSGFMSEISLLQEAISGKLKTQADALAAAEASRAARPGKSGLLTFGESGRGGLSQLSSVLGGGQ